MTQGRRAILELLERYDLVPRKALGQHFLADPNLVRRLVGLAAAEAGGKVVEVGAGTGTLTRALGRAGFQVVAYEVDERLRPVLSEVLDGLANIEVRFVDALAVLPADLGEGPWTLVANLPYNIGTPLLLKMLTDGANVDRFVVMVQREVADRLMAGPGTRIYGIPSVVAALHADVRREFTVGPQVFVPAPKVDSVVVTLQRRPAPPVAPRAIELASAAFNQRRKMLRRSLVDVIPSLTEVLAAAGIAGDMRAEQLSPSAYVALAEKEASQHGR
ncbi:MAG: 16S rRNA (adenine(1518)-N(6)/adenine(1519)-N(6))-dimethyltransferase RsmA [Acidimicrobiia bacterium]|nr:16S rRNA (adenine(1518)-N(6)/adenine(1519)-N(6))-dimethyltransferase RsmA [Acidimicrobiia bacterium]MDH3397041.1 16S rRNA (adenine(1518)-N(6)/adenine(1519)-N(6))-dimethyltransferase RsmA [Acidimicrobiia bacterium]